VRHKAQENRHITATILQSGQKDVRIIYRTFVKIKKKVKKFVYVPSNEKRNKIYQGKIVFAIVTRL